jgi:hypothetical protein
MGTDNTEFVDYVVIVFSTPRLLLEEAALEDAPKSL